MTHEDARRAMELIQANRRRLHQLELQLATQGSEADPKIALEIEDIKERIALAEQGLTHKSLMWEPLDPSSRIEVLLAAGKANNSAVTDAVRDLIETEVDKLRGEMIRWFGIPLGLVILLIAVILTVLVVRA